MRSVLINATGKVFAYIGRDGVIVLICDDQPHTGLFEVQISTEELMRIIISTSSNNNDVMVTSWIVMSDKSTERTLSI